MSSRSGVQSRRRKHVGGMAAISNLCHSNWFYSVPFPSICFHQSNVRFQIRSIEKILEWLVAMVAKYFEHYKYIYSPRPLYEIEIKRRTTIPKRRRQVGHAGQRVRMLRAQ